MKYLILILLATIPAVHAGQWTYTDPAPGGGYTTWTPGYQPIYTTPTPGGGWSTYNPNPATHYSPADVINAERYYDTIIRPHLDEPRRR